MITLSRRVWVLCGVLALGVCGSLVAWVRLTSVTAESDPVEYLRRAGAAAFARMPTVPVGDTDSIEAAIEAAPVADHEGRLEGGNRAHIRGLREAVLDFLEARLGSATPDAYSTQMASLGYRFKTKAEYEHDYGPLAKQCGRVGVESDDLAEVFAASWMYAPARAAVPKAIATGPDAMAVCVGTTNANRAFTGRIAGTLGEDLWVGGSVTNCRFWMRPPVTRSELLVRDGDVLAAQVGIIGEVQGSGRHPFIVNLFYDRRSFRWWVDGVQGTNFGVADGRWACCEF